MRAVRIASGQVHALQVQLAVQVRVGQVRAVQVRAVQVRAVQVRVAQIYQLEICSLNPLLSKIETDATFLPTMFGI